MENWPVMHYAQFGMATSPSFSSLRQETDDEDNYDATGKDFE